MLSFESITKHFGNFLALDDVSLQVRAGTIHALLGENGAGKTTLMRIAFGLVHPDEGRVAINGRTHRAWNPQLALEAGLGMVHQHFSLVPTFTVAENIAVGGRGRLNRAELSNSIQALTQRVGFSISPGDRVEDLPISAQQRVEILRVLARRATVLILDEPTAVLAPSESADLLQFLVRFAKDGGSVILITHKLREAIEIADDLTVLRRGKVVFAGRSTRIVEHDLAEAMLGKGVPDRVTVHDPTPFAGTTFRAPHESEPADVHQPEDRPPVATLTHVSVRDRHGVLKLADVSLEVFEKDIVGVAGVEGSGHYELLRLLAGRITPSSGTVAVPRDSAFIPEDRHRDGLVESFSLTENIALRGLAGRTGFMRWRQLAERTRELISRFDIRPPNPAVKAGVLSGGNQQRLVVARELSDSPLLIVAESPTRGLDLRAAATISSYLRRTASSGAAVIWYSSDIDELLSVATRIIVVHAGRAREVRLDRSAIAAHMVGAE